MEYCGYMINFQLWIINNFITALSDIVTVKSCNKNQTLYEVCSCHVLHQVQHWPPWWCVRTTLVWPLTSVLWGASRPTASPSNSGPLCQILLWGAVSLSFIVFIYFFFQFRWLNSYRMWFHFQVRDYSGTYTVKLLTCTSPPSLEYTIPPVCNPRETLTFDLDIRFQQVNPQPV